MTAAESTGFVSFFKISECKYLVCFCHFTAFSFTFLQRLSSTFFFCAHFSAPPSASAPPPPQCSDCSATSWCLYIDTGPQKGSLSLTHTHIHNWMLDPDPNPILILNLEPSLQTLLLSCEHRPKCPHKPLMSSLRWYRCWIKWHPLH